MATKLAVKEHLLSQRKPSNSERKEELKHFSEEPRNQGSFIDTLYLLDVEISRKLSFCAAKDSNGCNCWRRTALIALEISGHGLPWIIGTLLAVFFYRNERQQFALNVLLALFLDLIFVGFAKITFKRQRPDYNEKDMFATVSVDKFSFPSGHSTRAAMIAALFKLIVSSPCCILLIYIWATCVAISRVVLGRHHVSDVVFGALIGLGQYWLMVRIWLSMVTCQQILTLVPFVDLVK